MPRTPKLTPTTKRPPSAAQKSAAKRRKKAVAKSVRGNEETTLFEMVTAGNTALESVASDWVERYQEDPCPAMGELVQFFFSSSGCKGQVDTETFDDLDIASTVEELSVPENFSEDGSYPIASSGVQQMKGVLSDFVDHLVVQVQNSTLHDGYFLETLILWLIQLCSSSLRQLRHTATFAVLKLNTALVKVANKLREEGDITMRQLESEKKKSPSKRASGKIELLKKKLAESQTKLTGVESQVNAVVASVFSERYRDVVEDVRVCCIQEMGTWIKEYNVLFLSDQFLKYIGWMLHDKVAQIRLVCVQSLQELYNPSLVYHLSMFTAKFKERLLKMRSDIDETVAVETIKLLGQMLELELLEAEEAEQVCLLVYAQNRTIARTAGDFLCTYYFTEELIEAAKKMNVPKGKARPTENELKLKELIRYFVESNIHEHGVFFVDSLWQSTDAIKDWSAMTTVLQATEKTSVVTLTNAEETVLIEFMLSAVQRATGSLVAVLNERKRVLSRKEREAVEFEKHQLTVGLMDHIGHLLRKYNSDPKKAASLVAIPQYFELDVFSELRADKLFDELLEQLHDTALKSVNGEVMKEVCKTFKTFCSTQWTYQQAAEMKVQVLMDDMADHLAQTVKQCGDFKDVLSDKELAYNLTVALERMAELSRGFNMLHLHLIAKLSPLLRAAVRGALPDEASSAVFVVLLFQFWFSMNDMQKKKEPEQGELHELRQQFLQFMKYCETVLRDENAAGAVKETVANALSDLLLVYGPQLKTTTAHVAALVVCPSEVLQVSLRDFVFHFVFNQELPEEADDSWEAQEKIAQALLARRKMLGGFLRLVMYRNVDLVHAAPIFAQYMRHQADYGDIIKTAITHCLRYSVAQSSYEWSHVLVEALKSEYQQLTEEQGDETTVDFTSASWGDLKDLAKRFSLFLGMDLVRVRYQVVALHRFGIKYSTAVDPDSQSCPNLGFLEVIAEFGHKLLDVDKGGDKGVLPYLESSLPEDADPAGAMKSVKAYKDSLEKRKGRS